MRPSTDTNLLYIALPSDEAIMEAMNPTQKPWGINHH